MKTVTIERPVEMSGGQMIQGTIKAGAKAFSVLVDNIYADKPKSIVREILSNAWDAHQMAGKADKPFSVVFPSLFNPMFTCRDYGQGLSHEFMTTRYTVAFDSSKEDSNQVVGTWGIGRLSPLSYTDTYTATSYQRGVARHYSIVRNTEGVGFVFLGENKTDEPDGFQVSFPIQRQDINLFREAFKVVSLGFDVKPTIINPKTDDYWPELPVAASGSCWKLLDTSKINYQHPMRSKAFVRMGCVVYPLDNVPGITSDRQRMLGTPILFEAPIGSLAVTASREQLSFGRNEPTIDTLNQLIDTMAVESSVTTIKAISSADTFWNASKVYRSVRNFNSVIMTQIDKAAEWKGRKVNGYLKVGSDNNPSWPATGFTVRCTNRRGYGRSECSVRSLAYQCQLDASDNTVVYVADYSPKGDKHIENRVREHWSSCNYTQIVLIHYDNTKGTQADLQKLLDYFAGIDVVYVKSLPAFTPTKRGTYKPVAIKLMTVSGYFEDNTITAQELADGGFYVKLNNGDLEHHKVGMLPPSDLRSYHPSIKGLSVKVWGVPKTHWKKFEGSQWKELYLELDKWIDTHEDKLKPLISSRVSSQPNHILANKVTSSKYILDYLDLFVQQVEPSLKITAADASKLCGSRPWSNYNSNDKADTALKLLFKRYPMLQYVDRHNHNAKAVADYIDLIDKINP